MRTTLTLDDDVTAALRAESCRSGRPLQQIANECLGASLAKRQPNGTAAPFRVEPLHLGAPLPERRYDRIGNLLDDLEGAEHR